MKLNISIDINSTLFDEEEMLSSTSDNLDGVTNKSKKQSDTIQINNMVVGKWVLE